MSDDKKLQPSDLAGIYNEIAEVIGIDLTILLHSYFQGQQITFPKKLYSRTYVIAYVNSHMDCEKDRKGKGKIIKDAAKIFGYTERQIRQILKEQ